MPTIENCLPSILTFLIHTHGSQHAVSFPSASIYAIVLHTQQMNGIIKMSSFHLQWSLTKKYQQANVNKTRLFMSVVHNLTKLAQLQATVNEMVEASGDNTSVQINVTKFVLDNIIDDACSWVSMNSMTYLQNNITMIKSYNRT